jgi:hypothetical protein
LEDELEPNAFVGKKTKPTAADLTKALGPAKALWDQILDELKEECPRSEWNSYSVKAGWSLKLKKKDRTILYLGPLVGKFRVAFVFGDKAMRAAREAGLPKPVLKILDEANKYAEGTGIRFEVTSAADVEVVKKLAAIKLAN